MSVVTSRVIFSDNGVLSDISQEMASITDGTSVIPYVAGEDYIFIGSIYPFSNRFIKLQALNTNPSLLSIDLWNGQNFVPAVDIIDGTKDVNVSFGQDGVINWKKDKTEPWVKMDTDQGVTGLETLSIYGMYWARLSFDQDLTLTTELSYIGHKFATDNDLSIPYPELVLASTKNDFESSKPNWDEQMVWATEITIRDLKIDQKIISPDQLLDGSLFTEAVVHKTAQIIYTAFGKDWKEQRDAAERDYRNALNVGISYVDKNGNTLLDSAEQIHSRKVVRR